MAAFIMLVYAATYMWMGEAGRQGGKEEQHLLRRLGLYL